MNFAYKEALPVVVPAFILLALYTLPTGFFVRTFPGPLGYGVNTVLDDIGLWVLGVGYVAQVWGWMASCIYLDFLVLSMLVVLFLAVRRSFGLSRAVQIDCLMIIVLTLEVFVADFEEFNIHVTNFQAYYNIAPWFTNAHLLMTSLAVFALTFLVPTWRRIKIRRRALPQLR